MGEIVQLKIRPGYIFSDCFDDIDLMFCHKSINKHPNMLPLLLISWFCPSESSNHFIG